MKFDSVESHANYTAGLIKRLLGAKSYSVSVSPVCAILSFTAIERPDLAIITKLLRNNDNFYVASDPKNNHYVITLELYIIESEDFKYDIA